MQLAVREFGDPLGEPLLFFHGWPGSGAQAVLLDDAAKTHGFRIISPDRPGIGKSPIHPARTLCDWPALVRELAASLSLKRFVILGVSGGGPYALACAHAIPWMVSATAVVCGAPPLTDRRDWGLLHPSYRILLGLFHRRPSLVRSMFAIAKPFMEWGEAPAFYPPLRILLPAPDAESIAKPQSFAAVFDCQRDAFTSVDGVFADAAIYAKPWGFDPSEITIPVHFWHGTDDANFHPELARNLAARIPQATLRVVENEGHFSLPIHHAAAILAGLRKSSGQLRL